MYFNKKKVFVIAIALCLIAILSFSTFAWFNASDEITNTFKMANSDGDSDPDFTIEVWETETDGDDDADQDGDSDNKIAHDGITYDSINPGEVLSKDPTVENTGDYDQWVRVYVTFSDYDALVDACEAYDTVDDDPIKMLDLDTAKWTFSATESGNGTYVYYYNDKLTVGSTATLFTKVSIPGEFQMEDMINFANDQFTISVKAEALQADNTGDNAIEAFADHWTYSI